MYKNRPIYYYYLRGQNPLSYLLYSIMNLNTTISFALVVVGKANKVVLKIMQC